jgi:hypothetical protein
VSETFSWSLGLRGGDLRLRDRVQGSGVRVQGLARHSPRFWGLGFRVWVLGFGV